MQEPQGEQGLHEIKSSHSIFLYTPTLYQGYSITAAEYGGDFW